MRQTLKNMFNFVDTELNDLSFYETYHSAKRYYEDADDFDNFVADTLDNIHFNEVFDRCSTEQFEPVFSLAETILEPIWNAVGNYQH